MGYAGPLLFELDEGCLDFGNDLVIVGSTVWKACGTELQPCSPMKIVFSLALS